MKKSMGKNKKKKAGLIVRFKNMFMQDPNIKSMENTIKKQSVEILALKQMIIVYEQAIINEREVATNALKSLGTRNAQSTQKSNK